MDFSRIYAYLRVSFASPSTWRRNAATSIRELKNRICFKAHHDSLTSLSNRQHIELLLTQKFSNCCAFQAIGINICGFRRINDVFGYHNGDICLKVLGNRVRELGGLASRTSGGELLWVPEKAISMGDIEKIKKVLEQPIETGGVSINLKVAVGTLNCPGDAANTEELFRRMNIIMDEAQISRQLILHYADKLEHRYSRRLEIITELSKALKKNTHELQLFYQPKLNLITGEIPCVEALLRWQSDKLGYVPTGEFISAAEHAGLIEKVTAWVLSKAISDAGRFKRSGLPIAVAVNLSGQDVSNPDLLFDTIDLLRDNHLKPDAISFEITESDLVKHPHQAIQQLRAFRKNGFAVAIDDFGTGYSSMAYLKNLPISMLKIDKNFVVELDKQRSDQHIVKMVIDLAHNFGLSIVAEGVENQETLDLLTEWGCEFAQGYYICKPMSLDKLTPWLHDYRKTLFSNCS